MPFHIKNFPKSPTLLITLTSSNTSVEFPIASTRLRSFILKKTYINVIYTNHARERSRSTANENDSLQYVPNISDEQNKFSPIPYIAYSS